MLPLSMCTIDCVTIDGSIDTTTTLDDWFLEVILTVILALLQAEV